METKLVANVDEGGIAEGHGKLTKHQNTKEIGYQLIPFDIEIDQFVLGSSARKTGFVKGNSTSSLITIIDAVTAAGRYLKPGIVFKGQNLQSQ